MIAKFVRTGSLLLALGANPLGVDCARASLGGDVYSIRADADGVNGLVQIERRQNYDIHEITTDNGLRLREFVNRDGLVYGITWNGPVVPDLRQVLGSSFEEYIKATAGSHAELRRLQRYASSTLVVERNGHMRAYGGRAYLPAAFPAGTSPSELQ
jgi:hypothetical protein